LNSSQYVHSVVLDSELRANASSTFILPIDSLIPPVTSRICFQREVSTVMFHFSLEMRGHSDMPCPQAAYLWLVLCDSAQLETVYHDSIPLGTVIMVSRVLYRIRCVVFAMSLPVLPDILVCARGMR
jgi:hypothetical protein